MSEERLAQLQAVDPAVLTEVVRQDVRRPEFELTAWSVGPLSDRGFLTPGGLWRYGGEGRDADGARPWSVVVKILRRNEPELLPTDLNYWKREPLLAQSGLAQGLPGQVRAPRYYRVDESPDGAWLWMEQVADARPGGWGLDDYAFAARQLGHWNGHYLVSQTLPDEPWLARQHCRQWTRGMDADQAWKLPLHAKHVSADTRRRFDYFWANQEPLNQALEALPQTFSHFDCQRRNSFIRQGPDGRDELVLVDWAFVGTGAVGGELSYLVPISGLLLLEWPAADFARLEAAAFDGYLRGLREAGWRGEAETVRLGYTAWSAILVAGCFLGFVGWLCPPESRAMALQQFGAAEEELYLRWLPMLGFALDCADEARRLMGR